MQSAAELAATIYDAPDTPSPRDLARKGGTQSNGRPTALTPELATFIVASVAQGSFYEPACRAAGITYGTLREWVRRGSYDTDQGLSTPYSRFADAIAQAQAEHETALTATLTLGGAGKYPDWRAQAFVLERRYPQRWAPPKAETTAGITLALTDQQLGALGEALRVASAHPVTIDVLPTPQVKDPE